MLPTPDTSHVPYTRVYEPAEDSFLLLDTLSSPSESTFLTSRFNPSPSSPSSSAGRGTPLLLEIGPGSGVVLSFLTSNALPIFGTPHLLTLGIDVNPYACAATNTTVAKAIAASPTPPGFFLDTAQGDLATAIKPHSVDILVFNPPYVPTEELPGLEVGCGLSRFEEDSHLLALSYAGGKDGMETTDRLIEMLPGVLSGRGVGYVLLCAQNRPEEVKERMRGFGEGWRAETVGRSGRQAGWEKLEIVRVWRE
ncbi:hypothetical protein OQA88_5717 [Cercophora sp. LCS_1]